MTVVRVNQAELSETASLLAFRADYRASLTDRVVDDGDAEAIGTFDDGVTSLLRAVRLPRGSHVAGLNVNLVGRGWAGRKAADCRLLIDRSAFFDLARRDRPDSMLRTWTHESIHARQPFAPTFAAEWQTYRGFEEGLAEGLARGIVVDALGLNPLLASYNYFVEAYQTLAMAIEISTTEIWYRLWTSPPGAVADMFLPTLTTLWEEHRDVPLTSRQQLRIGSLARSMFASSNSTRQPDVESMLGAWRRALQ